jgi:hypothetical protein
MQSLINMNPFGNTPYANKSCIGFKIKKENNILMLCLSQRRSSRNNRKFEIVF